MRFGYTIALLVVLGGCTAEAEEEPPAQGSAQVEAIAKQVIPRVERAVGLKFKTPPRPAGRPREPGPGYLCANLDQALPPEELEQISVAYRLFHLIPDTLNMRAMLM